MADPGDRLAEMQELNEEEEEEERRTIRLTKLMGTIRIMLAGAECERGSRQAADMVEVPGLVADIS